MEFHDNFLEIKREESRERLEIKTVRMKIEAGRAGLRQLAKQPLCFNLHIYLLPVLTSRTPPTPVETTSHDKAINKLAVQEPDFLLKHVFCTRWCAISHYLINLTANRCNLW